MGARREVFVIVAFCDIEGIVPEAVPLLFDLVRRSKPGFVHYLPPGSLIAYSRAKRRGVARARSLVEAFRALQSNDPRLRGCGVGSAIGEGIADFHWHGRMKSEALGDITIHAMRRAEASSRERRGLPVGRIREMWSGT